MVIPSGELRLAVGSTADRQALNALSGEPAVGVTWSAQDPGVLSVLDEGGVAGQAAGTTSLMVTSDCGAVAQAPVRVLDAITIEPATIALQSGQTTSLVVLGADGTILTTESVWSGTDGTVARVDDVGLVSAIGPGAATIRAQWQGLSAQVGVEVTEAEAPQGHIAWTMGGHAANQDAYSPATEDTPAVVSIGNCGQAGSNHIWLSGEIPATSAAPAEQRFGWTTINVRIVAPAEDAGPVRDFRSFVVFDPPDPENPAALTTRPGSLFAPAIEWRTPDYSPEAWTGRTIELQITPDDPELLPSTPAIINLVNLMTPEENCCDPGDC